METLEPPRAYVPFHLAVKSSQPHDKEKTAWSFVAAKIVISFETQKENGVFFHFLEKFHQGDDKTCVTKVHFSLYMLFFNKNCLPLQQFSVFGVIIYNNVGS